VLKGSEEMPDRPREADVQANRERQLMEPYPKAAEVVDRITAEIAAETPATPSPAESPAASVEGIKTGVPSNYESSLGGHPKSMTDFEVKKPPGRL
jgi:hypothetical protein